MTLPVATLDHVVINARDDMDRAADIYTRLGFTLTERGYHSLGSTNHLAMFGTDYLELIAVPKGATTGRLDLLTFPFGLNGLVFGSEDSAITYGALSKAGVPVEPPVEFTRPVKVDGKERDARFRTVRMKAGVVPYGRVYYCHHFTRDLVWRDEWRHHANGVVAVQRALIVEPDPGGGRQALCRHVRPRSGARHQGRQERRGRQFALRHRHRGRAQGPVRRRGARRRRPQGLYGRPHLPHDLARQGGARLAGGQDR